MNEKLSALMDGELGEFEARRVLDEMGRDHGLRETWERYHLVSAALRNELELAAAPGLAGRVAGRVDRADTTTLNRPRYRQRRWSRLAGTAAVAASVTAVAILGIQQLQGPAPVPAAANSPTQAKTVANHGTRWKTNQPEVERTLNAYLVEHNEAAGSGVGGILPYVRMVGYNAEK